MVTSEYIFQTECFQTLIIGIHIEVTKQQSKNVAMATLECGIRIRKNKSKSIVSDHLFKIVKDNT